ncbi:Glutaredoxin 2 [Vibrio stylophorae]|uniref:Glutaredoxin 2 n=1 Tax=Vibrio stylophorae TaxID=659351 RepID=A0ABN8DVS0_9VIBR|nr:glutaredoxin 2 [Vibrio stylophorae]CAH0533953.1 Glutaredoxin 2 [Vibrio stylophorae]
MKLFAFDHCPFCLRALMMPAYKGLKVDVVYLDNDDVQARIDKVGANMVPILQKEDDSYMAESLDVVAYLDSQNTSNALLAATQQPQIEAWLNETRMSISRLLFPRWLRAGQPELATDSAKAYFEAKKTPFIEMSFAQADAQTQTWIAELTPQLEMLAQWLVLPSARQNQLSYDDILLFPHLRNLTVVRELQWPEHVKRYLDEVQKITQVPLLHAQSS